MTRMRIKSGNRRVWIGLGALLALSVVVIPAETKRSPAVTVRGIEPPGSTAFAYPGKKPVTGTVDIGKVHQEIAGFGASEAFYEGFLARHPHTKDIYDALFGSEHGLHTDFLRLQNKFRYATDLNFVKDSLAIVKGANSLRTSPMTIVMSSWSPPAVLKSNGSEKNGGTLIKKNGKYDYADFAQYWQDSVTVYRALGIDPTYVKHSE